MARRTVHVDRFNEIDKFNEMMESEHIKEGARCWRYQTL
jgi:hypothetical protein